MALSKSRIASLVSQLNSPDEAVAKAAASALDYLLYPPTRSAQLRQKYLPIIQNNLQQIGFYKQYQQLLSAYKQLPLTNKPDLDLEQHVLTQSLNALFTQVGEEEKAIREDPLGRGSSAIAAVFGR